jgi:hypothetical protein
MRIMTGKKISNRKNMATNKLRAQNESLKKSRPAESETAACTAGPAPQLQTAGMNPGNDRKPDFTTYSSSMLYQELQANSRQTYQFGMSQKMHQKTAVFPEKYSQFSCFAALCVALPPPVDFYPRAIYAVIPLVYAASASCVRPGSAVFRRQSNEK